MRAEMGNAACPTLRAFTSILIPLCTLIQYSLTPPYVKLCNAPDSIVCATGNMNEEENIRASHVWSILRENEPKWSKSVRTLDSSLVDNQAKLTRYVRYEYHSPSNG